MLGVGADMLQEAAGINPWLCDGQLLISSKLKHDPNIIERVSGIVLYMFRWRKFVDSRFCTIGPSMRAVVCSLAVGLQQLVQITRDDCKSTDYHLHGFGKISQHLKAYMVTSSVAAWVPDGVLYEIMEDERVCLRAVELQNTLLEELAWVDTVSEFTWKRLAHVVGGGMSWAALRSSTAHACHLAGSFMDKKIFAFVQQWPWRLTQGDIVANLQEMKLHTGDIVDVCTHKIRELLQLGLSLERLVDGVKLIRDTPWPAMGVEQAYGPCAAIHKQYPMYALDMVSRREVIHQCRGLFTATPADACIAKQERFLKGLGRRQPGKTSGRHAFMVLWRRK